MNFATTTFSSANGVGLGQRAIDQTTHSLNRNIHLGKTAEAIRGPAPVPVPLYCIMGKSGAYIPGDFVEKTVVFIA